MPEPIPTNWDVLRAAQRQEAERLVEAERQASERERRETAEREEQRRAEAAAHAEGLRRQRAARADQERRDAEERAEGARLAAEALERDRERAIQLAELLEQDAQAFLNERDGPVGRYLVARELELHAAEGPLSGVFYVDPLPGLNQRGTSTDQVVALAALLPVAAARLRLMVERTLATSALRRAAADRRVVEAASTIPARVARTIKSPRPPRSNLMARSYRRRRVVALAGLVGGMAAWLWIGGAFGEHRSILAWLRVLVVIGSGFLLAVWLGDSDGREAITAERNTQTKYLLALADFEEELEKDRAYESRRKRIERTQLPILAAARKNQERAHRIADTLDALARQARVACADLEDEVMTARLRVMVERASSLGVGAAEDLRRPRSD